MNPYLPITPEEREQMLKKIGVDSIAVSYTHLTLPTKRIV